MSETPTPAAGMADPLAKPPPSPMSSQSFPEVASAFPEVVSGDGVSSDGPPISPLSGPQSPPATQPPAPSQRQPDPESHSPLVTTRVGIVFVGVGICTLACALAAHSAVRFDSFQGLMWIFAVSGCAIGGLVSMRSTRSLRTIEKELRRTPRHGRRWEAARPIIGSDPITASWNELLEDAAHDSHDRATAREPAALDQEVITLARAMRGLPVAWIITDLEGRIRFAGPAACGILGLDDVSTHVGRDLPELLGLRAPDDAQAEALLERLLSDIRMVTERHKLDLGARQLHLRVTRNRLSGRSGDGEGLAWVLADETQQRLTTEARDQFVMTATHELRTPLSNLQAYAEALQEKDDLEIEQQKEFCNIITSEANRLGRLVDQLLTVSQMEAGSMTVNRHELELLPMLEYSVEQLSAQAEQKKMTIISNLSAKLPTVQGDRDKLQAALVNLVGNAVKYTPAGGEVTLRCETEEHWVRVDIEDNGPGIPEDEQSRVFDKFFRGSSTRDSEERGNGLGLAFSREIARLHGGDIELQSSVGEGSTFTLRLPVGGQSRSGV